MMVSASAEMARRLDGSASRIAGIFIITLMRREKEIMHLKICAFPPGFTKADLLVL